MGALRLARLLPGWTGKPQATGVASRAVSTSSATPPIATLSALLTSVLNLSRREAPTTVMGGGDSPNSFCFHITDLLGKLFSGRYTHSIFL